MGSTNKECIWSDILGASQFLGELPVPYQLVLEPSGGCTGTKGNWEHKLCPSFHQLSIPEGLPFDCLGGEPVPPEQQVKLFSAQAEGGYLWLSVKAKPYMLQFGT